MKINTTEQKGKEGVKELIKMTKDKKKKNPIIEELEEMGVFD